jgi:Spy/CpxP family protein refolding chaperone
MKKAKILITAVTLTLLSSASFAESEGKMRRKGHFKAMMSELKLSDDQIQKFKDYRKKNKGEMKGIKTQIKSLRSDIKDGFIKKVSDSKLEAMHAQMGELHSKSSNIKFKKMLFLKSVLSKEQRQSFMELKSKRHKRR